jgi:hypothetical protein
MKIKKKEAKNRFGNYIDTTGVYISTTILGNVAFMFA